MINYYDRKVIVSGDGSSTILINGLEETYHSRHGAIQESLYVFIEYGLNKIDKSIVKILEIGFGTGLNAWLTLHEKGDKSVVYHSTEPYPLTKEEYSLLNYPTQKKYENGKETFLSIHQAEWNVLAEIQNSFSLKKLNIKIEDFESNEFYDLIYFDAFAPNYQQEIWTETVFKKLFGLLSDGGIVASYCSSGYYKRALKSAGFSIEKYRGPIGKRDMVFGIKKC